MIKIEKNIPIPSAENKYPFNEMEIGDSFLVECDSLPDVTRNRSLIYNYAVREAPKKFMIKKMGNLGLRVWRIQ